MIQLQHQRKLAALALLENYGISYRRKNETNALSGEESEVDMGGWGISLDESRSSGMPKGWRG